MIPIQLTLSGFLSYRQSVTLDFNGFDLACISGPNGAGKSSLLDAMTWVLFGVARKRDDSIIHLHPDVNTAEVTLIFSYEGDYYRVQRINTRGKATILEFHILQAQDTRTPDVVTSSLDQANSKLLWKPLTERTQRETQARIESILRMDYETFVNASFFLQGKADLFSQMRPADRKRVLGNILGLDLWEIYRQKALQKRRVLEGEIATIDGRLDEIRSELAEEQARLENLDRLQDELARQERMRKEQEKQIDHYREILSRLNQQRKLVDAFADQLTASQKALSEAQERRESLELEIGQLGDLLSRQDPIRTVHAAWEETRRQLERWDKDAQAFHEQEKRRQVPLDQINAERSRLQQNKTHLENQQKNLADLEDQRLALEEERERLARDLTEAEECLQRRAGLQSMMEEALQEQSHLTVENQRWREEMENLRKRIEVLSESESAQCPVCNSPLSKTHQQEILEQLQKEGKELGDSYRHNQARLSEIDQQVQDLREQIASLADAEKGQLKIAQRLASVNANLDQIDNQFKNWHALGEKELALIHELLSQENFCPEIRHQLAQIDAELKSIGYDAAAHDRLRQSELEGRRAEADYLALEKAQARLEPLKREVGVLSQQITTMQELVNQQELSLQEGRQSLETYEAQAPDLASAEREFLNTQELENRLRMEVGAARQKVDVLADLKKRKLSLEKQRQEKTQLTARYQQLERAFGKDGVQALLIEQALPEIEKYANEILHGLTDGEMALNFITQASFKDKNRADKRETLDIVISDSFGQRDYELYSGGEAFRINFAIRLALSRILAQRAGARLQTLVIDEGFGSQDEEGRQRLVEAINLVRKDFAKILVITHMDELKDIFPTRIEVDKTDQGSTAKVVLYS